MVDGIEAVDSVDGTGQEDSALEEVATSVVVDGTTTIDKLTVDKLTVDKLTIDTMIPSSLHVIMTISDEMMTEEVIRDDRITSIVTIMVTMTINDHSIVGTRMTVGLVVLMVLDPMVTLTMVVVVQTLVQVTMVTVLASVLLIAVELLVLLIAVETSVLLIAVETKEGTNEAEVVSVVGTVRRDLLDSILVVDLSPATLLLDPIILTGTVLPM